MFLAVQPPLCNCFSLPFHLNSHTGLLNNLHSWLLFNSTIPFCILHLNNTYKYSAYYIFLHSTPISFMLKNTSISFVVKINLVFNNSKFYLTSLQIRWPDFTHVIVNCVFCTSKCDKKKTQNKTKKLISKKLIKEM